MTYHYKNGVKKGKRFSALWIILPFFGIVLGGYILVNAYAPAIPAFSAATDTTAKKLQSTKPDLIENRLYIPKINVDVLAVEIEGDESAALEKGAIHRAPDSGNPKDGGNYVLAAHRFNMGWTPTLTRAKSPFYSINKVAVGDQIFVDYDGTRYAYEVTKTSSVAPDDTSIETKTDADQLTVYSCDLYQRKKARTVVIAKPIGTIAWVDGIPKLKTDTN